MRIHHVESGAFPEYDGLNPQFRAGSSKLRYVLDTSLDNAPLGDELHPLDLDVFLPFFRRLSAHACGSGCLGASAQAFDYEPSRSIVTLKERIDIAHYLEHLVLDIQYDLGVADSISGVTLGIRGTPGEFLTVVESEDVGICVFAVNTALAMMHQALYTGRIDPRYRFVLQVARWLSTTRRRHAAVCDVTRALHIDAATARSCLAALKVLEFPVEVTETTDGPGQLGTVLVVEDNEDGREILHDGLTALGYRVRCAPDGRTGVEILSQYDVSAVVLDIYLPDLDGVSIARWLLETQPATRLVLISGGIEIDENDKLSNTAIQFLPKPFRVAALHSVLQTTPVY